MKFTLLATLLPFSQSFIPLSTLRSHRNNVLPRGTPSSGRPLQPRQDPPLSPSPGLLSPSALELASLFDGAQEAWTSYNDALQTNPLLVKSVTAGVILGAADLAGQALEDFNSGDRTDLDLARTARFAFFGLVLQVKTRLFASPWLRTPDHRYTSGDPRGFYDGTKQNLHRRCLFSMRELTLP